MAEDEGGLSFYTHVTHNISEKKLTIAALPMEKPHYGQQEGESAVNWLRRLVAEGAPEDIRAYV